nr:LOW QUALITY PROTEIN: solute carrier family 13 member 2-like [Rhipicephalus microplus]
MAFYWSVEACPLAATSLMPVFLFPLLGILSSTSVASFYLNDIGILLLCSLIMAGAVETSNLHKRIALRSLLAIGTSNLRLLLGFMVVTMVLSMWIPNTASTSIMAPIAIAVVDQMHASAKSHCRDVESADLQSITKRRESVCKANEKASRKDSSTASDSEENCRQKVVRTTMLLSVAYSANIGGTGSLIGTGSNLVLKGLMDERGPSSGASEEKVREEISRRYRALGPMSFSEWCVTFLMTSMILLWFTMKPQVFPGWVEMIPNGKLIRSSTPSMLVTFLLFVIPKYPRKPGGRAIITWKEASERAQWGIVILIGARAGQKMRAAFGALKEFWRLLYIVCVPLILLPVAACIGGKAGWCAYILLWMAFYWSAEVVPLAATSLMPVFLFPLFGIVPSSKVATFYLNEIGLVLLCSLVMAGAVEISNLHKRIALRSLLAIGTSNLRLLLGFMLVTMSLSMWIPNTASTSIMAPIVMAVVDQMHTSTKSHLKDVERRIRGTKNSAQSCCSPWRMLLTSEELDLSLVQDQISYSKGLIDDMFPESTELTFATWMLYNAPTMLICVLIGLGYLLFSARKEMRSPSSDAAAEKVREEIAGRYRDLGPMSFSEWCVMFLMSTTILLWFTMKPQMFPGWVEAIPHHKFTSHPAPAMLAMFLLFVIPKDPRKPGGRGLITWREASERAQWGVMILVGGGMCLAEGCKQSGLSAMLVQHLKSLDVLPNVLTVFVLCFAASMFTEVTSNTAVSTILLPVVCEMAIAIGVHPLYLAMPVTIGCSFSFMLPAATPPNAIVYELAKLKIPDMARPGFFMNMICVVVEVGMIHAIGFPIFGLGILPEWARHTATTVSTTPAPNATDAITLQTVLTALNYTQLT